MPLDLGFHLVHLSLASKLEMKFLLEHIEPQCFGNKKTSKHGPTRSFILIILHFKTAIVHHCHQRRSSLIGNFALWRRIGIFWVWSLSNIKKHGEIGNLYTPQKFHVALENRSQKENSCSKHFSVVWKGSMKIPENSHGYPKWWFGKGGTVKLWPFLVSMLDSWGEFLFYQSENGIR